MKRLVVMMAACGSTHAVGPKTLALGGGTVDVDGVALAYEVRGSGPPCVAFPGGPGLDAKYLRSDELERAFTVIYVDPLGTGASGKLPATAEYSLARDVASLEALRQQLQLDKLCLLGHSYGGFVALTYAIEHGAHMRALIAYSTSPATDEAWVTQLMANTSWFKDEPWHAAAMAAIDALETSKTEAELQAAFDALTPMYFADWGPNEAKYRAAVHRSPLAYDVNKRRVNADYDVRPRLKTITVPTLVIVGKRDFLDGPVGHQISDGIPGARLVELETGHYAHVEQPAAFGQAVGELAAKLR